jgi:hypothetical protein
MGPIDWLAVFLAANLAVAVGIVWYGPLFRTGRPLLEGEGGPRKSFGWAVAAMLAAATLIGHNFARIGPERLHERPWLYWMMSGGLALFLVAPALLLMLARYGVPLRNRLVDAGYWVVALLVMGTVFWAMG